jgi:hypothetical protein
MALTINGHIKSTDSESKSTDLDSATLEGYLVEVFFEQKAPPDSPERRLLVEARPQAGASSMPRTVQRRESARTDSMGSFMVRIPDEIELAKTLHFAV